jgi:hypothetical protein
LSGKLRHVSNIEQASRRVEAHHVDAEKWQSANRTVDSPLWAGMG